MLLTHVPHWKTIFKKFPKYRTIEDPFLVDALSEVNQKVSSHSNVGFLFATCGGFNQKAVDSLASQLSPNAVVIGGCVGAIANVSTDTDEIIETDSLPEAKGHFSFSLSNMPYTQRVGFHIPASATSDIDEALNLIPSYNREDDSEGDWKVFVILVDDSAADEGLEKFIQAIQQRHPNAQVVGGIMGTGESPLFLCEHQKATIYEDGILGIAIGGSTVFNSQVSRACKPLNKMGVVTNAEGSNLNSITVDGVESVAWPFLEKSFQRGGHNIFVGISRDLSKGFTVHNVLALFTDGSVKISAEDVQQGDHIQVFALDAESAREDLELRLQAAKRACASQSKEALGALLFTCGGRGKRFYNEINVESNIFAQAMPDIGLSGFFAGGEIGPEALAALPLDSEYRGKAQVQGFTAVFGTFFVPQYVIPQGRIIESALINRQFIF